MKKARDNQGQVQAGGRLARRARAGIGAGFTLVEMLMATAITATAIGGAMMIGNISAQNQRQEIAMAQQRSTISKIGEVVRKRSEGNSFIGVTSDSNASAATMVYADTGRPMRVTTNITATAGGTFTATVDRALVKKDEDGRNEMVVFVTPQGSASLLRVDSIAGNVLNLTQAGMPLGCAPDTASGGLIYPISTIGLSLDDGRKTVIETRNLPQNASEAAISTSDAIRGVDKIAFTYIYTGGGTTVTQTSPKGSTYEQNGVTMRLSGINVATNASGGQQTSAATTAHLPVQMDGNIQLGNASGCVTSTTATPGGVNTQTTGRSLIIEERGLPLYGADANVDYTIDSGGTNNVQFRNSTTIPLSTSSTSATVTAYPVTIDTPDGIHRVYEPTVTNSAGQSGRTVTTPVTGTQTVTVTYVAVPAKVKITFDGVNGGTQPDLWQAVSYTGPLNDPNVQQPDQRPLAGAVTDIGGAQPGRYRLYMPHIRTTDANTPGCLTATENNCTGASFLTPDRITIKAVSNRTGAERTVYDGWAHNLEPFDLGSSDANGETYSVNFKYRKVYTNGRVAGETCKLLVKGAPGSGGNTTMNPWTPWQSYYTWFYLYQWYMPKGTPIMPPGYTTVSSLGGNNDTRGVYNVCLSLNLNHISPSDQTVKAPVSGYNLTAAHGPGVADTGAIQAPDDLITQYVQNISRQLPNTNSIKMEVCATSSAKLRPNSIDWDILPANTTCTGTNGITTKLYTVAMNRVKVESNQLVRYGQWNYAIGGDGLIGDIINTWYFGTWDVPVVANPRGSGGTFKVSSAYHMSNDFWKPVTGSVGWVTPMSAFWSSVVHSSSNRSSVPNTYTGRTKWCATCIFSTSWWEPADSETLFKYYANDDWTGWIPSQDKLYWAPGYNQGGNGNLDYELQQGDQLSNIFGFHDAGANIYTTVDGRWVKNINSAMPTISDPIPPTANPSVPVPTLPSP